MLTAKDVAEKIGVTPAAIHIWVRKKRIPHYRFEGAVRFDEQEIEAWFQSKKVEVEENTSE